MACRVVKNEEDWHIITIKGDCGGDVTLVGPPNQCYLSCHGAAFAHVSISGPETLRALAHAILKSLPPKKRKR